LLRQTTALWATPQVREKGGGDYTDPDKAAARIQSGHQVNLQDHVPALWSTPKATDGDKGGPNQKYGSGSMTLPSMVYWSTPTTNDAKNNAGPSQFERNSQALNVQAAIIGPMQNGLSGSTEKPGQLNPEFVSWLMGYPTEWVCCAASVTRLSRKQRQSS